MTQADLDLLKSRSPDISKITAPTLLIQGTADTLFSLQEADTTAQTLMANGVPTQVIWFCGGHGVCLHNPLDPTDGAVIKQTTLAWLDHYVMGLPESTGPQFQWVDQRGQWYSSNTYPVTPGAQIVTSSDEARSLPLVPYLGGSGIPFVPFAFKAPYALNLKVPAATTTTYVVGAPKLSLTYSGTGSSTHVYAQLVDNTTGLVLSNLATPIPVTLDGQSHTIDIPLEPVAYTMRPGASVTLQLVGSAGLYASVIPTSGVLDVTNMQLTLPTADPTSVTPTTVV
jgi:ABC-2 type transport system ATP-binding protein